MNHFPMSRIFKACLLVSGVLCAHGQVFPATRLAAPSATMSWFTLDGGGGASRAGRFSLTGTLGQPDAAPPATGGRFRLTGGFWPGPGTIQTPGAPFLNIERLQDGSLRLFWLMSHREWVLESTPALGGVEAPAWSPVPLVPQSDATHAYVVIQPAADVAFYRLVQRTE